MKQQYIFYLTVGGMSLAAFASFIGVTSLMYVGIAIMLGGALLIPKLDESNQYQHTSSVNKIKEKVINVEVLEKPKQKYINSQRQ